MKDRSRQQPKQTDSTRADKAARSDRLATEMRKNLMKRKQQQRQKSEIAVAGTDDPGAPDDHG
jgi:hypothetical protein